MLASWRPLPHIRRPSFATSSMSDTALTAAAAAFDAEAARDWQALFAVLDPAAIQRFKTDQRRILELSEDADFIRPRTRDGGMLQHVFGVSSLAAYDALPPALVLRRWLVVSHSRRPEQQKPTRQLLGEVREGSDLAHVVFREHGPNDEAGENRVRVISARRTTSGWRVTLGGGLVADEAGGVAIGYNPGAVDPTEGEADFIPPSA